jgi:hypothetical protein
MVKQCGPPSQGWRTFLHNHAPDIAAMDLFVVPTIGFDLLYVLVVVRLARRDLVWINVTSNPTADWIARQITEDLVVLGKAHLRRILTKYSAYYNELRTHRSLNKDAPIPRAIQLSAPVLGGLHHHYCRI